MKAMIENCKGCGKRPIWAHTPFGAGIGCASIQCEDRIVNAPTMREAIRKWNEMQEEEQ